MMIGKHFDSLFLLDHNKNEAGPFMLLQNQGKLDKQQFSIVVHDAQRPTHVVVQGFVSQNADGTKQYLFVVQGDTHE